MMDAGILPLKALSTRFKTVRRESLPTSAGDLTGDLVAHEVQDVEGGKRGEAGGDLPGNVFSISDDEGGEGVDATDRR